MIKVLATDKKKSIESQAKRAVNALHNKMKNNQVITDEVDSEVDNFILELPWDHHGCFQAITYILKKHAKFLDTFKEKFSYDLEKHLKELADETSKAFNY